MSDHQQLYLDHQARKREVLRSIVESRHSDRVFADDPVDQLIMSSVLSDLSMCPSSCNRRGVSVSVVADRDLKSLLGGLLVGGVGWIHRAPVVLLYFASIEAYGAPGEGGYMPYLDAGAMLMQCYLSCESLGLKTCFCNPNIRPMNKEHFYKVFTEGLSGEHLFCGAQAIGRSP